MENEAIWESQEVQRGDTRIHYLDSGGDGTPVVFGHGFFMDATMFTDQAVALADRCRVLAVDARGHGRTESAAANYDYWDLAEDQLAVLDDAGIGRAHLIGHSQGGFTALRFVLRHPERVASLTLIASEAAANSTEKKRGYDELFALWRSAAVPPVVLEQLGMQLIGDPEVAAPWAERWAAMEWKDLGPASQALRDRDDVSGRLAEIDVPVLLISGSLDASLSMSGQVALAAGFGSADVTLIEIEGGAHAMNLTHGEAVNRALREFLLGH